MASSMMCDLTIGSFAFSHSIAALLGGEATSQNSILDCKNHPLAFLAAPRREALCLSLTLIFIHLFWFSSLVLVPGSICRFISIFFHVVRSA